MNRIYFCLCLSALLAVPFLPARADAPRERLPSIVTDPVPDPGGPRDNAIRCLALTDVEQFGSNGAAFGVPTTLNWNIETPDDCSGLHLWLGSQSITSAGSREVEPDRTRAYGVVAKMLGLSTGALATEMVVAGDVIGYVRRDGVLLPVPNPPTYDKAVKHSKEIIDALAHPNRRAFMNRVIELHLIPFGGKLTELPHWAHLDDCPPDNPDNCETKGGSDWSEAEGAGGMLVERTNRIAMAVAEKELVNLGTNEYPIGYILAHEMGHTVHKYGLTEAQRGKLQDAFDSRQKNDPWVGLDKITSLDTEEYFAEATAAWFQYPWDNVQPFVDEFTPGWIQQNDPALYDLLTEVYRHGPE